MLSVTTCPTRDTGHSARGRFADICMTRWPIDKVIAKVRALKTCAHGKPDDKLISSRSWKNLVCFTMQNAKSNYTIESITSKSTWATAAKRGGKIIF